MLTGRRQSKQDAKPTNRKSLKDRAPKVGLGFGEITPMSAAADDRSNLATAFQGTWVAGLGFGIMIMSSQIMIPWCGVVSREKEP